MNYVDTLRSYRTTLEDRFIAGKIPTDKYVQHVDKLSDWEQVWREGGVER